jgi:ketosteroid isomerase-like protein
MNNQLREQLLCKTKDFFRLFEEKDFDNWIELWANDCINHSPYAIGMSPGEMVGKEAILESFKPISKQFDRIQLNVHEIIVDETKRTVIARMDGDMVKKDGEIYQNSYIFLLHYDKKNKIKECYEYFNPIIAGKAFGLLDKIKY